MPLNFHELPPKALFLFPGWKGNFFGKLEEFSYVRIEFTFPDAWDERPLKFQAVGEELNIGVLNPQVEPLYERLHLALSVLQ